MHAVLKHWHPMIGIDRHIPWIPGTPAPAPAPVPYYTVMLMMGTGFTAKMAPSHNTMGWGITMLKGTDIGPLIPHIGPPSLLTPLDILFSASKSYFGPAAIKAEGTPIAAALLVVVNPNLNCGTPLPNSVGFVLAFNTHFVGMTLGDILHGLFSAAIDWLLQAAIGWLVGKIGTMLQAWAAPYISYLGARFMPSVMSKAAAKRLLRGTVPQRMINIEARALVEAQRAAANRWAKAIDALTVMGPDGFHPVISTVRDTVLGFFTGGPMGLDAGAFGAPTPGGAATDAAQNKLNDAGVDQWGTGSGNTGGTTPPGSPAPSPGPTPTQTPGPVPTPGPTPTPTSTPTPTPGPTPGPGGHYDPDAGVCEP